MAIRSRPKPGVQVCHEILSSAMSEIGHWATPVTLVFAVVVARNSEKFARRVLGNGDVGLGISRGKLIGMGWCLCNNLRLKAFSRGCATTPNKSDCNCCLALYLPRLAHLIHADLPTSSVLLSPQLVAGHFDLLSFWSHNLPVTTAHLATSIWVISSAILISIGKYREVGCSAFPVTNCTSPCCYRSR